MGFLERLIDRYGDVFAAPPKPVATAAVNRDRFDESTWKDTVTDVTSLDLQMLDQSLEHDYVEDFSQDVFNLLNKAEPTVRDTAEMAPTHTPHPEMASMLQQMPEIQALRGATVGDRYTSAMAMLAMREDLDHVYSTMDAARQAAAEAEDARSRAEQAAQDAQDALDAARAEAEESEDGEPSQEAQDAAEAAAQAAEQASTTMLDAAAKAAEEAAQAAAGAKAGMRSAAKKAEQAAEEESDLCSAFGVEPGELQRMSFTERAELSKMLRNNRLSQFAKLIGAFRQMAAAEQRRRVSDVAEEIVGVKLGSDLTRLTPQEMVNLAVPELEDDFWYRWVNAELLVYDLAGNERQGKGPIIAVVDESGSMGAQFGPLGTREAWSKAFALALCDQARRQNRDFHYIGFSSGGQVWHLPFLEGKGPISDVVTMTEHFWGGGTSYEAPLTLALDIIEEHYRDHAQPKPDVVFISDDEYGHLDEDFMRRWDTTRDKTGLRCFGVAIAAGYGGAMRAVCDDVRSITDLTADPSAVKDIFRTV